MNAVMADPSSSMQQQPVVGSNNESFIEPSSDNDDLGERQARRRQRNRHVSAREGRLTRYE